MSRETKIHIKKGAVPVIQPVCHVPHTIWDKLKQELDNMEVSRINAKVIQPNEWVNSLVVVEKPHEQLWICLDLRDPNKAITMISLPYANPRRYFCKNEWCKMLRKTRCQVRMLANETGRRVVISDNLQYLLGWHWSMPKTSSHGKWMRHLRG